MRQLHLKPMDQFATRNPNALGRAINAVQTIWSRDGKATYSHTGIILDPKGTTFEALWTIRKGSIWDYVGEKVCIARWGGMTDEIAKQALDTLMEEQEGRWYPAWRVPLHIVPPLAKYLTWGGKFNVCSETNGKSLYITHLQNGWIDEYGEKWPRHSHYCGANPDMLSDEWHRWRGWNIIFEGMLEAP